LTSRFGQDQPICAVRDRATEALSWLEERCYNAIRFVSIGLATHVRYLFCLIPPHDSLFDPFFPCSATEVDHWIDADLDDIRARHPVIYDSWDPSCRHQVDHLDVLPLLDEHGYENRIYDVNGRKIARRKASIAECTLPCAILVNLRTVTALFQSDDDMSIDEDPPSDDEEPTSSKSHQNKISLSVYPQAFLHDYGHIQAKGPLQLMQPTSQKINSQFPPSDDLDSDDINIAHVPLVTGISTQMYNDWFHRAATQAGNLDVVRGRISAALAAPLPNANTSTKNRKTAEVLKKYCNLALPYARFADRTHVANCPTALRVESVYIIDMRCIPENRRNGRLAFQLFRLPYMLTPRRTLYEKLICDLVDAWSRTEVSDKLREHLLILKPGVRFSFPFCFLPLIPYIYLGLPQHGSLGHIWHQLPPKTDI
jgi:hypothetical protein